MDGSYRYDTDNTFGTYVSWWCHWTMSLNDVIGRVVIMSGIREHDEWRVERHRLSSSERLWPIAALVIFLSDIKFKMGGLNLRVLKVLYQYSRFYRQAWGFTRKTSSSPSGAFKVAQEPQKFFNSVAILLSSTKSSHLSLAVIPSAQG